MIPNDILLDSQNSVLLSHQKLPTAADGNKYRGPQPDSTQRVRDPGALTPKWDGLHHIPPFRAQETHKRGDRKWRQKEPKWVEDTKKTRSSKSTWAKLI